MRGTKPSSTSCPAFCGSVTPSYRRTSTYIALAYLLHIEGGVSKARQLANEPSVEGCKRRRNFLELRKGEVRRISLPRTPVNSVECRRDQPPGLQAASWRSPAHEATMPPICSSFGEGRAKSLDPGGARSGGRSRFTRGLLCGFRDHLYARFLDCFVDVGLLRHVRLVHLESYARFIGHRVCPASRGSEPFASGPGTRCQRRTPHEICAALGSRLLRVRVFLVRVRRGGRVSPVRDGGAGGDTRNRIPGRRPRERSPRGPSGSGLRDSGRSDILRFVARRLVGLRRPRGLALFLRSGDRGVLFVAHPTCDGSVATPRLMLDL